MRNRSIDKPFLLSLALLVISGFFIFTSASLGLLAREGALFSSVAGSRVIALVIGIGLFIWLSNTNYHIWRKYAFYIFVSVLIMNLLVFIPGLGLNHGGATRWIDLGFITIQPSEFLKFAFIIYFAAWLASIKGKVESFKMGIIPFIVIGTIAGSILLAQRDTDALIVVVSSGIGMLIVAGGKIRDIGILILILGLVVTGVVMTRPYAKARIMTYLHPSSDPLGAGYQIEQSLIAVGSGGLTGRGFGQSIQKFDYLPEPIGDSIFAVAAEEFGFIGSVILIGLYVLFAFRTLRISARAPDYFSGLLVLGIAILILVESFLNIAAMIGVVPLSGEPLLFVSHGGTALIMALGATGIIANISKYQQS